MVRTHPLFSIVFPGEWLTVISLGMYLVIFLSSMWFLLGDIGVKSRTNLRARPLNKAIVAANIVLFMTISVVSSVLILGASDFMLTLCC